MSEPNPTSDPGTIDELGFDHVIRRLRAAVGQLETGQLGLEESLRIYEEGVALARRGHQVLDGAEQRVELLLQSGEVAPFERAAGEGESDDA